jgi:hypothetical protein
LLSSRYFDLFAVNVALGWVCLCRIVSGRVRLAGATVWLAIAIIGLVQESQQHWRDFVLPLQNRNLRQQANVRDFLRTGDSSHLLNKPSGDIPYPNGEALIQRLASPAIRNAMPVSVRLPVALTRGSPPAPQTLPPALAPINTPLAMSTWAPPPGTSAFFWRSSTQPANALPLLRFKVAGNIAPFESNLQIVLKSSAETVRISPEVEPGLRWKTVTVSRPAGAWWIEVTDADPAGWLAFTEPVELGRLSWFAEKLLKHALALGIVGVSLIAVGAALESLAAVKRVA